MPTIQTLQRAYSVSDSDELMVSQSDTMRKATRAQLLAGVQPALAVPSNMLLGRLSAGTGSPEAITIGANLAVSNSTISAPAPFVIDDLPTGLMPAPRDPVPLSQGGRNTAVSYAAFMSGLSQVGGIDASDLSVVASSSPVSRRLADCIADAISIESFGAVGDGLTDDTAAFISALAIGRPLRLDGRVYVVNGPLAITDTMAIIGIAGATVIRRTHFKSSPTWINVSTTSFAALGITFDAGALAAADMPAVEVTPSCMTLSFSHCRFSNATGMSQGSGLSVSGAAGSWCRLTACSFDGNSLHGLHASGAGSVAVTACETGGNTGYGIRVEVNVACTIRGSSCCGNSIGISIGSWNTGSTPSNIGPNCAVSENLCNNNGSWGIAVAAGGAMVSGNTIQGNGTMTSGGGILARLGSSRLSGNIVSGGDYGIDARGCWGIAVSDNHISACATGIAVGGGQNVYVSGNVFLSNSWAVLVSAIEPALSMMPTGPVTIAGNWIGFTTPQGGGIRVLDAMQGAAVVDNDINGWGSATADRALWLHTDAAVVRGNRWNNQARFTVQANVVAGLQALVLPDTADEVLVTSAPQIVRSMMTNHQADTMGQIAFIKMVSGGSLYTHAQVTVSGLGNGAAANAIVSGGQVAWIVMTNPGSGYGPIGNAVQITIYGDGSGAKAAAFAGLPVPDGKRLRLSCNCQVQFAVGGASPAQQSWTGFTSTIPAFGAAELEGAFGGWRAVGFPPVDYLAPTGDGGAVLQSVGSGNLVLRPASGGALHIANSAEATGYTSSVGRGSPIGMVAAPPGSDFRNLNGGTGNTLWIKQTSTDTSGWTAIA